MHVHHSTHRLPRTGMVWLLLGLGLAAVPVCAQTVPGSDTPADAVQDTSTLPNAQTKAPVIESNQQAPPAPVSLHVQDIPVRAVLQLIAEEAGLNLVIGDSVEGRVTLRLTDVPWPQALDIVLQSRGLAVRDLGEVLWIAPQAEIARHEQAREEARLALEERVEMTTQYLPLSHGDAAELARLLGGEHGTDAGADSSPASPRSGFLSARGHLGFDRRTNALIVSDTPARVAAIRQLLERLDTPVDQVAIEARIVIADDSFSREIGARFGILGSGRRVQWSGPNVSLPATPPAGVLGLTILGNTIDWDVELSALQTEGRGEVLSNPRIITSSQKQARISQGEEIGYLTVTGGQSNTIPTVEFKDVLLELTVTPTITADGRVYLNLSLNKNELAGWVETGAGQVPRLSKREMTTSVLMEDGQTVSIGGVYEFRDRNSVSKVPFLANLPILGHLFKRRGRERSKVELLVLVTPQVIRVERRPTPPLPEPSATAADDMPPQ